MKINLDKLRRAGFYVKQDGAEITIEPENPAVSEKLIEILRSYTSNPMLQDLIVGTTLQTISNAQIMEHFE